MTAQVHRFGFISCVACVVLLYEFFFVTDEDDTPIVSLLQQQTASLQERVVPVSAVLF